MKNIGKGWVEGRVQELLGLSDAEAAYVEAKTALTRAVRERRLSLGLSQASMAKALRSPLEKLLDVYLTFQTPQRARWQATHTTASEQG